MLARRMVVVARRFASVALASLCSLAAVALFAVPVALAEELCPNTASRQGPSAALPDCRAYEQVTPVDKGDSQDLFPNQNEFNTGFVINDFGYASENGNRFLLQAESPLESGDAYQSSFVFSRGAQGWTPTSLSPGAGVHRVIPQFFNPDLSAVGIEDLERNHIPGGPEERVMADFAGPTDGPYATVYAPTLTELEEWPSSAQDETFVGASSDASHVLLSSYNHGLAPGDEAQDSDSAALYESAGGHLKLVNVQTDGSLVSQCGAVLGQGQDWPGSTHDAVSSDGSKVFFTAPDPYGGSREPGPGCWDSGGEPANAPQLYMRLNGSRTSEVSAPNVGVLDANGPHVAFYAGASADGSKVFFLSASELTKDAEAAKTGAIELYEYNTEAPEGERLVRVSSGESGTAEGEVPWVAGVSSDGSTVYFAALGALAKGASATNGERVNLYRYETATGKTTYIAAVSAYDYPGKNGVFAYDWYREAYYGTREPALNSTANWYVTGNGRYLLFSSYLPLTGYTEMDGHRELFRYDAQASEDEEVPIVCVSCGGGPAVNNATFIESEFTGPASGPQRPISEDGSYVFFESTNALVPGTNDSRLHVYEWHGGKISLISSPDDPGNAYFLGSSADGHDVFFGTHAQLVPQDTDVNGDVYDARIDGGFVGLTPSLCTGTGCQGVPAAPPIFATPSSVTFEGVGNFESGPKGSVTPPGKPGSKPKKCKRGFVKKNHGCVKKKAKKSAKGRK